MESRTLSPAVQNQFWSPSAKNKHCHPVSPSDAQLLPTLRSSSAALRQGPCYRRLLQFLLPKDNCSTHPAIHLCRQLHGHFCFLPVLPLLSPKALSMAPKHCTAHFSSSNIRLIQKNVSASKQLTLDLRGGLEGGRKVKSHGCSSPSTNPHPSGGRLERAGAGRAGWERRQRGAPAPPCPRRLPTPGAGSGKSKENRALPSPPAGERLLREPPQRARLRTA